MRNTQTYVGTILISINPYKLLPIYASNTVRRYVGKRIGVDLPHIFALAEAAYRALEETRKTQSIIIRFAVLSTCCIASFYIYALTEILQWRERRW